MSRSHPSKLQLALAPPPPSSPAAAATGSRTASAAPPGRLADFVQMSKPRITLMVVITCAIGFAFGAAAGWSAWALAATLAGTGFSCMSASVLNQVWERDVDGLMQRTRRRPLAAGRVSPREASAFAILLALAGQGLLWPFAGALAAGLAAFTILSYVFLYTPMKRCSSTATVIGAVPGAMPPLIGYAAASGTLGKAGWLLFAILFLWQLPHFLAIAWIYRDEYARAGMPMLPVLDPSGQSTFRQILLGCMVLLPLSLLPTMLDVAGMVYFFGAMLAGIGFLAFGVALVLEPNRGRARAMFFASLVYLPLVLTLMLVDRL